MLANFVVAPSPSMLSPIILQYSLSRPLPQAFFPQLRLLTNRQQSHSQGHTHRIPFSHRLSSTSSMPFSSSPIPSAQRHLSGIDDARFHRTSPAMCGALTHAHYACRCRVRAWTWHVGFRGLQTSVCQSHTLYCCQRCLSQVCESV